MAYKSVDMFSTSAARKAVKKEEWLLAALNSMAGDGLSIPSEDTCNFEVNILWKRSW